MMLDILLTAQQSCDNIHDLSYPVTVSETVRITLHVSMSWMLGECGLFIVMVHLGLD